MLHSAYSDDQIGPFENFNQLVEDTLVILGSGLKVFLEYALRFANGLKSQLLIGHHFFPMRNTRVPRLQKRPENQAACGEDEINFCFNAELFCFNAGLYPCPPGRGGSNPWMLA